MSPGGRVRDPGRRPQSDGGDSKASQGEAGLRHLPAAALLPQGRPRAIGVQQGADSETLRAHRAVPAGH